MNEPVSQLRQTVLLHALPGHMTFEPGDSS